MMEFMTLIVTPLFFGLLIWNSQPKKCKRCKEEKNKCICIPF